MQHDPIANIGGTELCQTASPGSAQSEERASSAAESARRAPLGHPILLTDEQGAEALGVSVRRFHDLRKERWFPRPVVLGPRLLRWPRSELEAAVAAMPRQAGVSAEPAQLRRAKINRMKAGPALQAEA